MSLEIRALGFAAFAGLFVVGATFLFGRLVAPSSSYKLPTESPTAVSADIIEGGRYYRYSCARCHASDGYGNSSRNVPSLVDEDMSDGEQIVEIEYGENTMPAFDRQYNTHQIETIVRYLHSLN